MDMRSPGVRDALAGEHADAFAVVAFGAILAPALLALLGAAWTWLPGSPLGWTLATLAVLGFPVLPPLVHLLVGPRPQQPLAVFLDDVMTELKDAGAQVLLQITLLAYHAYEMAHAILLTLGAALASARGMPGYGVIGLAGGDRRPQHHQNQPTNRHRVINLRNDLGTDAKADQQIDHHKKGQHRACRHRTCAPRADGMGCFCQHEVDKHSR